MANCVLHIQPLGSTDNARTRKCHRGSAGAANHHALWPADTQTQLAELPGRTTEGFRYSLSYPNDQNTRAPKACGRMIGRQVYYPAMEVVQIIMGSGHG